MKDFTHLSNNERRSIQRFIETGKGIRFIARKLNRGAGTISEEVQKYSVKGKYDARKAELKAQMKRKNSKLQCLKVAMIPTLKEYVIENMEGEQSPEGISGRIKEKDKHIPYASPKAIYKFVYSSHGRQVEKFLYSKMVKKKGGPKRGRSPVLRDGRVMIDKRPKRIEKRKEFGHFEGDFIESGKDGVGSLLVITERKTRFPFVVYTEDKSTAHINHLIADTLKDAPVNSITLDNDISFQKHKELSALVGTSVFFCHPMCPHEKGTTENRNRAVRKYIPKKSDLHLFTSELKTIETKLRTKFMKCLKWKTPEECWDEEMKKWKKEKRFVMIKTKKARSSARLKN
jgi:transposase, IS30 family